MDDSEETKQKIVSEWMEIIDGWLIQNNIPIKHRIFSACALFAQHAIESFGDGSGREYDSEDLRDKFMMSESFREFYIDIEAWYEVRYRKAFKAKFEWTVVGVVRFSGNLFEIAVPIIRREPGRVSDEVVAHFAEKIESGEDPLKWILDPPNWDELPQREMKSAEIEAAFIASHLRRIRIYFMTAECPDTDSEALRTDVPRHLEAAAQHLGQMSRFGLAIWECHQAAEKTLKLLIRQQGQIPPKSHELPKLMTLISPTLAGKIGAVDFSNLPTGKDAVAARYGEGAEVEIGNAYSAYRSALAVVSSCASGLMFQYKIADSRMTIRKPKFLP